MRQLLRLASFGLLLFAVGGCYVRDVRWSPLKAPAGVEPREFIVITTGYCPCGSCCSWRRNWLGRPVISSGPNAGKAKAVGVTASGTTARPGTIAADTTLFPFGTILYIPGYGYGRVEDRGGDIKGYHLDLFYSTHSQALQHGKVKLRVKAWLPKSQLPGPPPRPTSGKTNSGASNAWKIFSAAQESPGPEAQNANKSASTQN